MPNDNLRKPDDLPKVQWDETNLTKPQTDEVEKVINTTRQGDLEISDDGTIRFIGNL